MEKWRVPEYRIIQNGKLWVILDREGRQCGTFEHRWEASVHISRLRRK
jgi:hypothetical protein